ncbi:protein-export chaperone SecB [Curtobacterium flaccumfaciens pv. poinsettiae]|uniref:protein-export chaperone SecB n=1 Tax=Curtobacterium poinsettiae TaxID=159612 RepID=UPI001BDFDD94|nr:protein-export chaperone SecB [Curtobacterium flaccumfaciens]MBT1618129.1 protein-export chaperone SecB [Curtobacterium flaccumfaciens pv. poinsettiae]
MPEQDITVQDVVAASDLVDVSYYELAATQNDDSISEAPEGDTQLHLAQEMSYGTRDDDRGFRVRIRTTVDAPDQGKVVIGVSAAWQYAGESAQAISRATMLDFINNVAVMVLLPYIREATSDLTRRVFGSALVLPVIQRGQIGFTEDHASDS